MTRRTLLRHLAATTLAGVLGGLLVRPTQAAEKTPAERPLCMLVMGEWVEVPPENITREGNTIWIKGGTNYVRSFPA